MKTFTKCLILLLGAAALSCGKTAQTPLDAPKDLKATDIQKNSLSFVWNKVSGAEKYSYVITADDGSVVSGAGGQTASVTKTFYKLNENTQYTFKVCAVAGSSTSEWTTIVTKTLGSDVPPEPEPEPSGKYEDFLIPASEDQEHETLAFPGAEGGGMYTTGGRGYDVYHVTNLEDSGAGSLREGLKSGNRTIVFDVAGIIELQSALKAEKDNVTIAGQTAPGDGICLKNYTFSIHANNIIIRFIRCRMGDEKKTEDDAMNAYQATGKEKKNVIIDHCSMSWSTDECGSFYGNENFTLQYCILSEGLKNSVHDKGAHGYGGIWGGKNASFHHNMLADHDSRNPRFDHDYVNTMKGPIHFVNNVVYNWGNNSSYGGESGKGQNPRQINMVRNYYKKGPATPSSKSQRIVNPTTKCNKCNTTTETDVVPGKFYITDNFMYGSDAVTKDNWAGVDPDDKSKKESLKSASYMGEHKGTVHSAAQAFDAVTRYAGASKKRDSVDERICKDAINGTATYNDGGNGSTGGIIDTQSAVGGWPEYKATADEMARIADADKDGMPDWFEDAYGLDKNSAADGKTKTLDQYGRYTNLEMYLHYLVREVVSAQVKDGSYTTLK